MTRLACNTETHKRCARCEEVKPRTEFYKNKSAYDGLQGRCKACNIASVSEWQKANPKKHSEYNVQWDKKNPRKKRDRHLKWRLGIPYGTYDEMLAAQEGKCAICRRTDPNGRGSTVFHVDHCAETGNVRGLLCHSCNLGIGHFFHQIDFLKSAIEYLIRTSS